jgi:hypothetical protein
LFLVGDFASFFTKRRFRSSLEQLELTSAPLAALSAKIEERFLACGRALHDQAELTTRLSEQSGRLKAFGQHSEQSNTAIRRVGLLISTHLSLSEEFAREVDRLAKSLDAHAAHLQELLSDQQQLERSFAPMGFLHLFFRIESAALPVELQTLFHAVTAEMQRLYTDVSASFADHEKAIGETHRRAAITARQLHEQSAHHAAVAARKRTEVERSLAFLETELGKSDQRNGQLDAAIGDLNREIDTITVSLQYQDITRQKMEHVQMAARNVLDQFSSPGATPLKHRLRAQQVLCEVQAMQLGAVQQELESATTTIKSGLSALLERLNWIENECLSVASLKQITADMDAVTADMIAAHRITSGLMRDSLESLTKAIESTRRFAGATTNASDTMRRLAADLHLIGLNAQVQSVQANNGSLEVLSGAASAISREAGALSSNFETKLAATTESFTKLVESEGALHEKTCAKYSTLQGEDAKIFDDLTHELETGKALVTEVGSLLLQLKERADELLPSVDLADFSRDAIANARTVFISLAAACADGLQGDESDDKATLADLQSNYTMNSEREAHAAALGMHSGVSPAQTNPPPDVDAEQFGSLASAGTAGKETLGENVELF